MIKHTETNANPSAEKARVARLGKYTESTAPHVDQNTKYRLKKVAASALRYSKPVLVTDECGDLKPLINENGETETFLYEARVCSCGKVPVYGSDGSVDISQNPETGSMKYSNLTVCGNIWTCPVCYSTVAYKRKNELLHAMRENRKRGGSCLFWTQTIPHTKYDSLIHSLKVLSDSSTKLKAMGAFRKMLAKFGYIGSVMALEITYGHVNGWHPHRHNVLFFDRILTEDEIQDLNHRLKCYWMNKVKAVFGVEPSYERGSDLKPATYNDEGVSAYMCKWADELVETGIKKARNGSLTYTDLLRMIDEKYDIRLVHLVREFESSVTGRARIYWSRGLKDMFNIVEITDEEIAHAPERKHVATITFAEYLTLVRANFEGEILNIFQKMGAKCALNIIQNLHLQEIQQKREEISQKRAYYRTLEVAAARHLEELNILPQLIDK